jgi:serralysin
MASPTTWGFTSPLFPTGNPFLNGLISGTKWGGSAGGGAVLTYSFPQSGSWWSTEPGIGYGPIGGAGEPWNDSFRGLTFGEQGIIEGALRAWSRVADIAFFEVPDSETTAGDMRFGFTDDGTAHAYFPAQSAIAGDVWFGRGLDGLGPRGGYAFATVLHEIGHALGLKHPHDARNGFEALPVEWDSIEFSIMSYRSHVGASVNGGYRNEPWGFAQSPMIYDIATLQHMYGANFATRSGNTVYAWNPFTGEAFVDGAGRGAPGANRVFETVWDGGGIDTYDFSNYATNLSVDLGPGSWSLVSGAQLADLGDGRIARGNVFNAFQYQGDPRSLIENAVGGIGNDRLAGNSGSNALWGKGGADSLIGLGGRDALAGGAGNDALFGGSGRDVLVGGPGRDLLKGDSGADIFDFNALRDSVVGRSRDVVTFFHKERDRIDLKGIDADTDGTRGNQAFKWVDKNDLDARFTGVDGQLRLARGILQGDVDGDRRADFEIRIAGGLTAGDVIL